MFFGIPRRMANASDRRHGRALSALGMADRMGESVGAKKGARSSGRKPFVFSG